MILDILGRKDIFYYCKKCNRYWKSRRLHLSRKGFKIIATCPVCGGEVERREVKIKSNVGYCSYCGRFFRVEGKRKIYCPYCGKMLILVNKYVCL